MNKTIAPFLSVLSVRPNGRRPVWLMRQAGRYLPEYKALRAQVPSFIDFCLSPALAAEATLQPVRRFDMDAAILFADILLTPLALGQDVRFEQGEGPVLEPLRDLQALKALQAAPDKLSPVYETIARTRSELTSDKVLIGFAGGLWTVACYMIEGRGKNDFPAARSLAQTDLVFMADIMDRLFDITLDYLCKQIEAGAQVIQLFESHAGLLEKQGFEKWVEEPTARLVRALKQKFPDVPVIGFPRGATPAGYQTFALKTGVDILGLDPQIAPAQARRMEGPRALQGNLDPEILLSGGEKMRQETLRILKEFGPRHIFNLGHGVLPQTPPDHVAELVDIVHRHKD